MRGSGGDQTIVRERHNHVSQRRETMTKKNAVNELPCVQFGTMFQSFDNADIDRLIKSFQLNHQSRVPPHLCWTVLMLLPFSALDATVSRS